MLEDRLGLSQRLACQIAGQHRSTQRREPCVAADDGALRARLRELSRERPRWSYRRAHATLCEEGWSVNRKRVQRLWREEGLRVPVRRRKRRRLGSSTVAAKRLRAERPDHAWAAHWARTLSASKKTLVLTQNEGKQTVKECEGTRAGLEVPLNGGAFVEAGEATEETLTGAKETELMDK